MARITQQSSIHTTGVSYENEPIIRGDGAGEIMQWQPSDGGADGIYIIESVDDGPAFLGVGVTPTKPLTVKSHVAAAADIILALADDGGNLFRVGIDNSDNGYIELFDGAGNLDVKIDTAAASTFATGITVGSLDIGHGLGGSEYCTAVGTDALDASVAGTTGCTAIGYHALGNVNHADADDNTAVGQNAGLGITSGKRNIAIGRETLGAAATDLNIAIGYNTLNDWTGSNAVAIGSYAADVAVDVDGLSAFGF